MYEEKQKGKLNIDWKALLIKMAILLVVLILIIWFISLFKKEKDEPTKPSNINTNLNLMKTAAHEYFTGVNLPTKINEKNKLTLEEMIKTKRVVEFKDQDNNSCDGKNSYIEATKVGDYNYTIKVKLVCPKDSQSVVDTITVSSNKEDNKPEEPTTPEKPDENDNNQISNKPSTNPSTKPSTGDKPSTKPIKPTNPSTKPDSKPTTPSCTYGNKEYTSAYPLAYTIPGDCAANKEDYRSSSYTNTVNNIGAKEYQKLATEIAQLKAKTNADLYVESPTYLGVYNNTNTGLVGYQIKFSVRQRLTYSSKIIYEYYLDSNSNRKVIIDNRSSLNTNNNNTGTTTNNVKATSITLNVNTLELVSGETYQVKASVLPTNTTNKTVNWSTNDYGVISISNTGLITAKKAGNAMVYATIDGISATLKVTVTNDYLITDLTILDTDLDLEVGQTHSLRVKVTPNYAPNSKISYTSSNKSVATVTSSGVIKALAPGYTTITVYANNLKESITVYVSESPKTYTKTYYLMTYVTPDYEGKRFTQKFALKDIDSKSATIKNVTASYYGTSIYDYNRYTNTKWDNVISQYDSFTYSGNLQHLSSSTLKESALTKNNFSFTAKKATYLHDNYYGVEITTLIDNFTNVNKYKNEGYFLPLKVRVTYEV